MTSGQANYGVCLMFYAGLNKLRNLELLLVKLRSQSFSEAAFFLSLTFNKAKHFQSKLLCTKYKDHSKCLPFFFPKSSPKKCAQRPCRCGCKPLPRFSCCNRAMAGSSTALVVEAQPKLPKTNYTSTFKSFKSGSGQVSRDERSLLKHMAH